MRNTLLNLIAVGCFLTACTHTLIMSPDGFEGVALGSRIQDIERVYGEAFEVETLPRGVQEYHYIQRIDLSGGGVEQYTYVFTVYDGKIVGKEKRQQRDSLYRFVQ